MLDICMRLLPGREIRSMSSVALKFRRAFSSYKIRDRPTLYMRIDMDPSGRSYMLAVASEMLADILSERGYTVTWQVLLVKPHVFFARDHHQPPRRSHCIHMCSSRLALPLLATRCYFNGNERAQALGNTKKSPRAQHW